MINLARRRKMPLVWIHSETGATSWENFPEDVLRDKLADGLLRLGPPPTVPQIASANERLDVLLTWLDGFATGSGPRFRMLAVSSLVLHGLAIAAAVCGLVGWFSPIMSGAKFVLLFLAVCCAVYARYQQLHQQWIYPRVLAEMVRSLRFCHPLLSPSDLHGLWDAFPHFRRTLRGIHGKLSSGMIDPLSFPDSRRHYLDYRLNGQIRYYSQAAERTGTLLRWLNRLFQLLLVSAFVAASAYFIWKGVFLGVLTILLPLGSMVVLALKSALDLDGRYARFREIADDLSEIHGLLAAVEEPNAFVRGVLRVEKILLAEVAEWYQRNRHLQIH